MLSERGLQALGPGVVNNSNAPLGHCRKSEPDELREDVSKTDAINKQTENLRHARNSFQPLTNANNHQNRKKLLQKSREKTKAEFLHKWRRMHLDTATII
jgi:hypothetical protein